MYEVTVSKTFVAQHYLTVPNPGQEGDHHSHRYKAEIHLRGDSLDEFGYLVDIDAVRQSMNGAISRYEDETLNDLPEFEGRNPSVERFARSFCERVLGDIDTPEVTEIGVTLWEDDDAYARFERPV
ncbi:6-pyruvoyl trahydropterin synthase family protein [Haladaptatus caseinilyticus]|uniref:6-pyruvoyl trahydropterin synthase family protein n=1 Tax=Haladaptatus caseinilyticus TaxID=2993314 RepID=UPI00224B0727|nr:6-carboxytetrahydropterin synthase [Haladaptatus caseinilyticus]